MKIFSAVLYLGICFYSLRKKIRKREKKETIMKKASTSKTKVFPDVSKTKILFNMGNDHTEKD